MKALPVKVLGSAESDLDAISSWYREVAGEDVALRFEDSFERTASAIAENAELGTRIGSKSRELARLRKRAITGFTRYIVFYRIGGETIEILRVLHSSQDWWSQFEVE